MNLLFHSETNERKHFTSYQYLYAEEVLSPLFMCICREADRDCNTTGSATETEFKGHGGTVWIKQEINMVLWQKFWFQQNPIIAEAGQDRY